MGCMYLSSGVPKLQAHSSILQVHRLGQEVDAYRRLEEQSHGISIIQFYGGHNSYQCALHYDRYQMDNVEQKWAIIVKWEQQQLT